MNFNIALSFKIEPEQGDMDQILLDRSHLTGTGPSSYGTGPIVFNKIGPVPTWTFS